MAFASAGLSERQAVRDNVTELAKLVTLAHDAGPLNYYGPLVDASATATVEALGTAGAGGGTTGIVSDGQMFEVDGGTVTVHVLDGVVTLTLNPE